MSEEKYCNIDDKETGTVTVGLGTNEAFYQKMGMKKRRVAYNNDECQWYLAEKCPQPKEKTYVDKRVESYPSITEQLDMLYWDMVNGTSTWQDTIDTIKKRYPKEDI